MCYFKPNNRKYKNVVQDGKKELVEKLKAKNMHGLGFGDEVCSWCGVFTTVIHKHHYPIQKKYGGTKIVKICPSCHYQYHHSGKSRKLQFRLSGDDLLLFEQHKKYNGISNESEFIKDKLLDSLYKDEIKRQQYELEGI